MAIVGVINIPIIKYSVDWWNTLHQPATFTITEKPAMPPEMWLPLLVMVLAFYGLFTLNLFMRMRLEWNVKRSGKCASRLRSMRGISVSIVVLELGTI
jgi:ABC-type transport system involved in cytochrome c biogenesis permease subunit